MPEQTAKALQDGWLITGDAGYLSPEGYLHVVDRIKDMIITDGENVYSAEVEATICRGRPARREVGRTGTRRRDLETRHERHSGRAHRPLS
jgi:acyl-CoA synthetase (AMP-forming)/AMP-acid ligase II